MRRRVMTDKSYNEICRLAADMLEKDLSVVKAKYDRIMDEQDGDTEFRVALAALGSILEMTERLRVGSLEDRLAVIEQRLQRLETDEE
jgi:hypothetical protein